MHMGSGKAKLDPIFYVLDHSDVPAKNLLPTHMLRSPELIDAGVELVKRGGYIDCTAGSSACSSGMPMRTSARMVLCRYFGDA